MRIVDANRDNNFSQIRLILAVLVVYSHAYYISGANYDPIAKVIPYSFGWVAVTGFFFLSGALVFQAALRAKGVIAYARARVLRIIPGLWVMLVSTTLVLLVTSNTAIYDVDMITRQSLNYVINNALIFNPRYELLEIFADNPYPRTVNGSLWTLRFEIICYLIPLAVFICRTNKELITGSRTREVEVVSKYSIL